MMKKNNQLTIDISDQKLKKIVADSLGSHMKDHGVSTHVNMINEAYVSEPKAFKLTTDMLSQKTKDGHTELYHGYVDALNRISAKIDSVDRSDVNSQHSQYRSTKLDETYNLNAKWLHELYFANCFDPNSEIYGDSKSFLRLGKEFGDFDRWQKDFIACAMSAGEGWAICGYHLHLRKYINTFISHHSSDIMIGLYPIIVLDMWSHSYHRDYVIDKKSYIITQMKEFNWNVIEDRFETAEKLGSVL